MCIFSYVGAKYQLYQWEKQTLLTIVYVKNTWILSLARNSGGIDSVRHLLKK